MMATLTKKYLIETIQELKQKLRDQEYSLHVKDDVTDFEKNTLNKEIEKLENEAIELVNDVEQLTNENKKLKNLVSEIEEYIKDGENGLMIYSMSDIKQILQKYKESKE